MAAGTTNSQVSLGIGGCVSRRCFYATFIFPLTLLFCCSFQAVKESKGGLRTGSAPLKKPSQTDDDRRPGVEL